MLLDFLRKQKSTAFRGANKQGEGFRIFYSKAVSNDNNFTLKAGTLLGTLTAAGAALSAIIILGQHASVEFTLIIIGLISLCGLVSYDLLSRKAWESKIANDVKKIQANHDRIVREVARNRNDIGMLKDGLSGTANALETQGRRLPPSSSVEARLFETIIEHLGSLGDSPREKAHTTRHNENVMELEILAPPKRPAIPVDQGQELDFENMSDNFMVDVLRSAVRDDNLDLFVQPVVTLPQRKPKMYEILARIQIKPGVYISANRYMKLAKQEQLVTDIDNLLLLRCLQIMKDRRNLRDDIPYILNISSSTLNDTGFMGDLISFLSENKHTARRLVFEFSQKQIDELDNNTLPILDGLSQLGCRFSMDTVRNGRLDINMLRARHIRFIKMDATWLIREGSDRKGMSRIIRLKKQLDAAGIDLIVEKVEREEQVRELLDFAIDYGQGYLFGKPDMYAAYRDKANREKVA
jgi:cyclic-di-GMP phosphodiesterase TipF (flagellum assembly factor)